MLLLDRDSAWTVCLIGWLELDFTSVWLLQLEAAVICKLFISFILLVTKRCICTKSSAFAHSLWILLYTVVSKDCLLYPWRSDCLIGRCVIQL